MFAAFTTCTEIEGLLSKLSDTEKKKLNGDISKELTEIKQQAKDFDTGLAKEFATNESSRMEEFSKLLKNIDAIESQYGQLLVVQGKHTSDPSSSKPKAGLSVGKSKEYDAVTCCIILICERLGELLRDMRTVLAEKLATAIDL